MITNMEPMSAVGQAAAKTSTLSKMMGALKSLPKGAKLGGAGLLGLLGVAALSDTSKGLYQIDKQTEDIENQYMPEGYGTARRLGWESKNIGYNGTQASYDPKY